MSWFFSFIIIFSPKAVGLGVIYRDIFWGWGRSRIRDISGLNKSCKKQLLGWELNCGDFALLHL